MTEPPLNFQQLSGHPLSACASYFGRVVWLAESLARPDVLHDARAKPRAALPQSLKALLVSDTVVVIGLVVLYGSQPSTLFVGAVICASSYIQVVSWAQGQLPGLLALLGTLGVVAFTMRVVSSLTWLLVGLLLVEFLFAFGVFYSLFYVLWREGASGTEGLFWRLVRKLDVRGMLLTEADIQTLIVELSPRNVLNRSLVRNAPAVAHEFSVADGLWTKAVDSVMERAYVVLCDLTDITEGGSLEWEIKQCLKRGLPIVFTVRSSDLDRARLALVRLGTAEGTPMFQWMPRSLADRSLSQWRKDDIFHIVSYLAFLFGVEQSTRSTTMASP